MGEFAPGSRTAGQQRGASETVLTRRQGDLYFCLLLTLNYLPGPFGVTWRVGDINYEGMHPDWGGAAQIYHLNMKSWRETVPVPLVSWESGRDELGPEMPNSTNSPPL